MLEEVDGDEKEESDGESGDEGADFDQEDDESVSATSHEDQGEGAAALPEEATEDVREPATAGGATLAERELYPVLMRRQPKQSRSFLTLTIQRVGIKDFERYIEPFISVVVCDKLGNVLERQDTPVAIGRERAKDLPKGGFLVFNQNIYINYPLEHMFEGNGAVFLELKHYKPDKKKISCRCWSLIESDEVQDGPAAFELYQKPSDYRRRASKIRLFSVKKLYLHAHLHIDVDESDLEARPFV